MKLKKTTGYLHAKYQNKDVYVESINFYLEEAMIQDEQGKKQKVPVKKLDFNPDNFDLETPIFPLTKYFFG